MLKKIHDMLALYDSVLIINNSNLEQLTLCI